MATVKFKVDLQGAAYLAANPTKVLEADEIIFLDDGRIGFGDGTTQLQNLVYPISDYILDLIAIPIRDCGTFDFSGNTFPSTGGTGTAGAIQQGNLFTASVSGAPGGTTVTAPYDTVTARIDNPGQTLANWRIQSNSAPASSAPIITSIASSSTPTPVISTSLNSTDVLQVTALAAAATIAAPTGTATNHKNLIIRIKDNGTARALSFNAVYRFSSDLAAPTTTVISKTMYLGFRYNSADSKWDCLAKLDNF